MPDFNNILLDVYDRTGNSQTPPTAVARTFKRYVNRWHKKILTEKGMESLRGVTITKASVADQPTYGVALDRIRYITESTNDLRLIERSLGWYRDSVPDPTAWTGTPDAWVPLGLSRIEKQPANASEIFVKSTSAADTTQTLRAELIRSNGFPVSVGPITLTGTTAVSLGSTLTDVIAVQDWYLSAAAAGTVTLHEDSGSGTELAKLNIGDLYPRYLRYALVPTPSAVVTYTIDGIVPITDLVQDTDRPLVPDDYHDLLVDGAVYEEWVNKGRMREATELRRELEKRIRDLRRSLWTYDEGGSASRMRTFEETISLPLT